MKDLSKSKNFTKSETRMPPSNDLLVKIKNGGCLVE